MNHSQNTRSAETLPGISSDAAGRVMERERTCSSTRSDNRLVRPQADRGAKSSAPRPTCLPQTVPSGNSSGPTGCRARGSLAGVAPVAWNAEAWPGRLPEPGTAHFHAPPSPRSRIGATASFGECSGRCLPARVDLGQVRPNSPIPHRSRRPNPLLRSIEPTPAARPRKPNTPRPPPANTHVCS